MEKLLHRRTIRNYLNYFSEQHWDAVISYTLEYGIILLLQKYNINLLSPNYLAELLFNLKEKEEDENRRKDYKKGKSCENPIRKTDDFKIRENERGFNYYDYNVIEKNKKNLIRIKDESSKERKIIKPETTYHNISKESALNTSSKKEISGSFEVLQTSERPKKSEDKRRLIKIYEQKRRDKIKANNSLSFAYSPVKKKTIYYTTEYDNEIKIKKSSDKYSNVQSKIKEEIKKDKEKIKQNIPKPPCYSTNVDNTNNKISKQEQDIVKDYYSSNNNYIQTAETLYYKTTKDKDIKESKNINTNYTNNEHFNNENKQRSVNLNDNYTQYSNSSPINNKPKYVLVKDEVKNLYLVNNKFVYPVDEWKYGNQFISDNNLSNNTSSTENINKETIKNKYYNTDYNTNTPQWKTPSNYLYYNTQNNFKPNQPNTNMSINSLNETSNAKVKSENKEAQSSELKKLQSYTNLLYNKNNNDELKNIEFHLRKDRNDNFTLQAQEPSEIEKEKNASAFTSLINPMNIDLLNNNSLEEKHLINNDDICQFSNRSLPYSKKLKH